STSVRRPISMRSIVNYAIVRRRRALSKIPQIDGRQHESAMSFEIFRARRSRVLDAMAARGGGVAIQPTAPERLRNRDSEYPFRFDSHFFYLSGFTEPESVIALIAHGDQRQSILFCRDRNEEREIWEGHRHGPEAAREVFGF